MNNLVAIVDTIGTGEIDALIAEYLKAYDVVPELAPGEARGSARRI